MEAQIFEMIRKLDDRVLLLENGVNNHYYTVEQMKQQMATFEQIQVDMEEHNKRREDALNNNTNATLLLIESNKTAIESNMKTIDSNTQLAQAFQDLKGRIEKEHDPVIAWYRPHIQTGEDIKAFFRVNRVLFKWILASVFTLSAFTAAVQTFL